MIHESLSGTDSESSTLPLSDQTDSINRLITVSSIRRIAGAAQPRLSQPRYDRTPATGGAKFERRAGAIFKRRKHALAPLEYSASWDDFCTCFGFSNRRQELLQGLRKLASYLKVTDCPTVYIGGSFVSCKLEPGDFDGTWEREGTDLNVLYELDEYLCGDLFDQPVRPQLKAAYGGGVFPSDAQMKETGRDEKTKARLFFQFDKRSGIARTTVAIDLSTMPLTEDPIVVNNILGSEAADRLAHG